MPLRTRQSGQRLTPLQCRKNENMSDTMITTSSGPSMSYMMLRMSWWHPCPKLPFMSRVRTNPLPVWLAPVQVLEVGMAVRLVMARLRDNLALPMAC